MSLLAAALFTLSAHAGALIEVVDPAGAPIPTATVRFEEEGWEAHRVHPETAILPIETLYPAEEEPIPLAAGDALSLRASAPGYRVTEERWTLGKGRAGRRAHVVTLRPLDLNGLFEEIEGPAGEALGKAKGALAAGALAEVPEWTAEAMRRDRESLARAQVAWQAKGLEAIAEAQRWRGESEASVRDWSEARLEKVEVARARTAEAAISWAETARAVGASAEEAVQLCLATARTPARCGEALRPDPAEGP
ncbi:MAG: hypothetical protein JXX28_04300 [Deltaproteobacteria bacterium]|nr:hypothetical protein [Deltaproteobacteria bacterium]